ncbi:MAG: hypothetical protein E7Z87_02465 [Cyanobacteria bacterium SIG26]|nr:hypothetical protein [Cyanobacteria bacterium SIG26]
MKRLFLIFAFLITFIFTSAVVKAADNALHTITLEKNNAGYNIILVSDKVVKVNKKVISDNELMLTINGINSAETVNAIYKGTNSIDSLIIENIAQNKLRVHIKADNIRNSTLIVDPIYGEPTIVGESLPLDKILWSVFVVAMFSVIFRISKEITEEEDKILIRKDIKEREIELYRKYKQEMVTNPDMGLSKDFRMKKMMKKIDRKIDERLTASLR